MSVLDILNVDDTKMMNNIWDFKKNLILKKDGSVFAMYRVPSEIINTVDEKAKDNFKSLSFSALSTLESYKNYTIARIPIEKNLVEIFDRLSEDIDWEADSADLAEYVLNDML